MPASTSIPDVPTRHPGRVHRIDTNDLPPQSLSDELIDLWERATLLFYGYEWQASAENFLYLSSIIELQRESAQCLLNAAIIFARLGDYHVASEALEGAAKAEEFRPLALYLWGHVEFELGDLQESETCFKAALEELGDNTQYFARLGLDFVLNAEKIRHNLSAFDIQNISLDTIPDLGLAALPTGSVFESPQRSPDSGYASPESPTKSLREQSQVRTDEAPVEQTPDVTHEKENRDSLNSAHTQIVRSLEYSKGDIQWHDSVGAVQQQQPTPTSTPPAPTLTPKKSVRSIGGLVRQFSTRRRSVEEPKPRSQPDSPRKSLLSRLVPKEAKNQDHSTHDIAGFIRDLPSRSMSKRVRAISVDREPNRDSYESQPASPELPTAEDIHTQEDHTDESAVSPTLTDKISASNGETTEEVHTPRRHNIRTRLSMRRSKLSESSLPGRRMFASSIRSVHTEATSAMADDEASDSGNERDHEISTSVPSSGRKIMA